MRLSMIDHEEHQRKEADEKKKQAATQAEADTSGAPGSGPSTLEPQTRNPISVSPSPSTSSGPVPMSQAQAQDLPPVKRNSLLASLSRNRTPPPSSHTPSTSVPRNSDASSSSWHRRAPSPAPYSTLSAAMSAASTASAILGNHPTSDSNGAVVNNEVSRPNLGAGASDPSPSHLLLSISTPSGQPKIVRRSESPSPPETSEDAPPHSTSPYDNLPSSPESLVAHEPLLGSRAMSD